MGAAVVGVAVAGGGAEHQLRPPGAELGDQGILLGRTVAQAAVAAVEEVQLHGAQHPRRLFGLGPPLLGRAASALLAPREVQEADLPPLRRQQGESAAAAQLHVVRMGADGENVELRHGTITCRWAASSSIWSQ